MDDVYEKSVQEEFFDSFSRRAVSSGSPSLDGSSINDDERGVCSDSEMINILKVDELAKQVKGSSSGDLEHECARERIQATKAEMGRDLIKEPDGGDTDVISNVDENGWEDVLGSRHLLRKVVHNGHGEKPQVGQLVTIRVYCPTNDVDSHENLTFLLGYNFYVDAWDIVLQLMQLDEISMVRTSARFAYGDQGLDGKISPNAAQEYEIELLAINDLSFAGKPIEDIVIFIENVKERGNFHYKRNNYDVAIRLYEKCIEIIEKETLDTSQIKAIQANVFANLSACYMKLNDWDAVFEATGRSLAINGNNSKVLFRRAKSHIERQEYKEAINLLKTAVEMEPQDKFMSRELIRIQRLQADQISKEKKVYRRMLNGIEESLPRKRIRISIRFFALAVIVCCLALGFRLLYSYSF